MPNPIQYEDITPDPQKRVALSRFIQKPGDRYWHFTHFHPMHEILLYNEVVDSVININGKEYPLSEHTLVFIPSMLVHDVQIPENINRSWTLLQFESDILNELQFNSASSFFSKPAITILSSETYNRFDYLLNWYLDIYNDDRVLLGKRILSLILQLTLDILKNNPQVEEQPLSTTKGIMQFTPLLMHLEKNNLFNISLDDACAMCNLSKFHFSRLFKSYFTINFNDYLLRRKVQMAMSLLADMTLSIADISEKSGFNDTAYFSKKFKLETGKTPNEYRKSLII